MVTEHASSFLPRLARCGRSEGRVRTRSDRHTGGVELPVDQLTPWCRETGEGSLVDLNLADPHAHYLGVDVELSCDAFV